MDALQAEIEAVRRDWDAFQAPPSIAMGVAFPWLTANAWRG